MYDAYGAKRTFELFAQSGIMGIDFNTNIPEYCSDEHDKQFYLDLKQYVQDLGMVFSQAHAPYGSSYVDEEKTAKRFDEIVRGIRNASYVGAPMIVVHPCVHLDYRVEGNPEKMFEYNMNFYTRLIPYAEEYGIKIAIENIGDVSVTADPKDLNKLYDTLNNPVFTVCFDVGHSLIEGFEPGEAVRTIGHRLVNGCTHVHDNNGRSDMHTVPYQGKIDWESFIKALADIGYEGNLSYEASGFMGSLPKELYPEALKYKGIIGHHLINRFVYYKNNKA